MRLVITNITLENFKCFRHKEITFDGGVTTIRGRNGQGKTTIADAILWCLFGKNSAGQATFDLKTHDEHGNAIPHLDHSVEMTLVTDAISGESREINLKRTLRETWIKKRGATEETLKGHTTEYFINGNSYTAKDYEKFISELVSEEIFRSITNPQYFPSLKWQQQRNYLESLVDMSDVAPSVIENIYTGQTFEEARKHISYQIKKIKEKLDKIPVRLEEQNKALPECLDWDEIEAGIKEADSQLEIINSNIISIKSSNGEQFAREQIMNEIRDVMGSIYDCEEALREQMRKEQDNKDKNIAEASRKFNILLNTQRDLESFLASVDTLKSRCNETLRQCETDAQAIRDEWAANNAQTLTFDDGDCLCPTCGQYMPAEMVAEKRQKAIENLNRKKADTKALLTERANKVKSTIADAEAMIKDYDDKKVETEKNLADTKQAINDAFAEKAKIEKSDVKSLEQRLSENERYKELVRKKNDLQEKLNDVCMPEDGSEQIAKLEAQKTELTSRKENLAASLATRQQYEKITALIDGIKSEQKGLVEQLSELEKQEDIARQYQDSRNALLEERVNQHFSLVKWKMFRTVNNGGDPFQEPYCECYVDGAAYHDGLNQASRLNAGLDIINTLCRNYNVTAPIVIDNSESNLNILSTASQQIRLEVFDSELQVI